MGPFWLGTARTSRGDSGGACISSDGYLIGMNVSTTCMPIRYPSEEIHANAISEAAVYVSKNVLVGADVLVRERELLEGPMNRKPQSTFNSGETIFPVWKDPY